MNETKATRYQRLRRRTRTAGAASAGLMLTLLVLTPASRNLADWSGRVANAWPAPLRGLVALCVLVTCVGLLWEAVALPAAVYLSRRVDRRFGQTAGSARAALRAQLLSALAWAAAVLSGALCVRLAMAIGGDWWWLAAGALLGGLRVTVLRFAARLLNRAGETRPLARPSLQSGIKHLADQSGCRLTDVREWRSAGADGATALITGVGRTRQVLVASELLRDWSDDEIAVVVAHELAHHVYRDLWRTLAVDSALLTTSLWTAHSMLRAGGGVLGVQGVGDLAALPAIGLVAAIVWTVATPIRLAQSRAHERRADQYALAMTGAADAFSSAIRRLGARHLAEERPSRLTRWLYHRHPSMNERLALAESARRR